METIGEKALKSFNAAFESLVRMDLRKMTVEERERYDASINAYRTQLAVIDYVREEVAAMNSRKIALKMRQMGISENLIMEITGLSIDEIRELQ